MIRRCPPFSRSLLFACSLALTISSVPAFAESSVDELMKALAEQSERLSAQEKALEDSRKNLEQQQKALIQERVRFNQLKSEVMSTTGRTVPEPARTTAGTGAIKSPTEAKAVQQARAAADGTASAVPQEVGVEKKEVNEKPPEITALTDVGGVLTPKGKIVLTPALEYTRSSATRVDIQGFSIIPAINIGLFEITKTDRDTLTPSISARYGLTSRFEVNAKVPYVYRNDATKTRPVGTGASADTLSEVTGMGIGDVEVGASYQINRGQQGWPFLIGNMRFKAATGSNPYEVPTNAAGVQSELPTGSGFYALQPSITAIYPSDPVVFYSNLGYLHNFARSFKTVGEIEPGDSVSASFGMSFSLNERASFSLGYSHNTVFEPKQNGSKIANSTMLQAGTLDLGYSYSLTDRTSLNFGVSAGITEDAPDARLTFRVPMTFGQ